MGGGQIVALGATSKGLEAEMDDDDISGDYEGLISDFMGIEFRPHWSRHWRMVAGLVNEAKAELARLVDDVQKNRNRPEELP